MRHCICRSALLFESQIERSHSLNQTVVLPVSILAAVLAIGFLRERRLRLALEALIIKLLKLWRNPNAEHNHAAGQYGDPGDDQRL